VVKAMHKTIKRVTEDISGFHFNTMVAGMIEYVNELTKRKDGPVANTPDWNRAIETLVLLMAPSTPYVAEEMWERLGKPYSVHQQEWPDFVEEFTRDDVVEIAVQVNGKVRDKLMMSADASEADALRVARSSERVQQFAGDATPKRVIYVPGRLLNIIV
jgi:leucyl-tRNA synthetase